MSRNRRTGGPGSNQYQTKPVAAVTDIPTRNTVAAAAVSADDYDSEDIAAMFDPSRRAWVQAGIPGEDIDGWKAHGFGLRGAVEAAWAGLTPGILDYRHARFGGNPWIARWAASGFEGRELVDWETKFKPQEAAAWRDRGYTIEEAHIASKLGLLPADLRRKRRTGRPLTITRADRARRRMLRRWKNVAAGDMNEFRRAGAHRPRDVSSWLRLAEQTGPDVTLEDWVRRGSPETLTRVLDVTDGRVSHDLRRSPELAARTFAILDADPNGGLTAAYEQSQREWQLPGSWTPGSAAEFWAREGITTPGQMREWYAAGVMDPRMAGAFNDLGLTPIQCSPWVNVTEEDRVRIPAYLAAGFTPDTLPD